MITTTDRISKQKIFKKTLYLNVILSLKHLIIHIEYSIQMQQNTHFSSAHGTLSRIDYMLGHKTYLS